jgi:hypothetical protein
MEVDDRAAVRLLARQQAVLSRAQAFAVGMNANGVQYRTRPGGPWQRLLPGVYLTVSGKPTRDQLEVAAALYAGRGSVITGAAALRSYAIDGPQTPTVDVLIPAMRRLSTSGFAVMHRTRRMPVLVSSSGPRWFALPPRAVADAVSGLARLSDARTVVASAVQQQRCTVDELKEELANRQGRSSALLRRVLAEVADGIRSAPEGELRDLIRAAGLPMPFYNPELYVNGKFLAKPDAWWPQAGLAVEVDSMRWHLSAADWERTMLRHRRMAAAGIRVLHISPHQLHTEPREILQDIAAALEVGAPVPGIVTRQAA